MPGALRQSLTGAYKKRALSMLQGVKKVPFKPEPAAFFPGSAAGSSVHGDPGTI
jgi:hypothetical protein